MSRDEDSKLSKDKISQKALIAIKLEEAKKMQKRMWAIQEELRNIDVVGYNKNGLVNIVKVITQKDVREADMIYDMLHPTPTPR